jgi:chromosome partitioning protein
MTGRVLALCNQKGGVGKSTTAFHLARSAVMKGLRVLVVDADPQGNITSVLTDNLPDDQAGLADVLSARASDTIADVVVDGIWEGLTIVPTVGETLGVVRDELVVAGAGREARLRDALHQVREDYDLVLIDCAPSLDTLTINGLTAANGVVVVTQSKLWSANGLAKLLDTITAVQAHYNPQLTVAGVLVNQHEARTIGGTHWAGQIQEATEARGLPLLQPPVPKRAVIADATEAAQGLDELGADGAELAAIYDSYLELLMGKK